MFSGNWILDSWVGKDRDNGITALPVPRTHTQNHSRRVSVSSDTVPFRWSTPRGALGSSRQPLPHLPAPRKQLQGTMGAGRMGAGGREAWVLPHQPRHPVTTGLLGWISGTRTGRLADTPFAIRDGVSGTQLCIHSSYTLTEQPVLGHRQKRLVLALSLRSGGRQKKRNKHRGEQNLISPTS